MVSDQYTSIRAVVSAETRVEGSRFVAQISPAATREEAEGFIARVRNEHHDATHHCYAYRIGVEGEEYRAHDGGEPHGSAGKPILAAIRGRGLTFVVLVISRYFGGTKLGVGGLARAYADAANTVLDRADVRMGYVRASLQASFPHACIGAVMQLVSRLGVRIVETVYDEEVHLTLEVRSSQLDDLRRALVDQTSGNVRIR